MAKMIVYLELDKLDFLRQLPKTISIPQDLMNDLNYNVESQDFSYDFNYTDQNKQKQTLNLNLLSQLAPLYKRHKLTSFDPSLLDIEDQGELVKLKFLTHSEFSSPVTLNGLIRSLVVLSALVIVIKSLFT
jgi:hypothetical protein